MTALESKQALTLLGDDAEDTARWMVGRTSGAFESRRLQLLDTVPGVIDYYSEGTAALAADAYMDARAGVAGSYAAAPIVLDRTVKIRRGVAWASEPLVAGELDLTAARMAKLARTEMTRPYRDTTLRNGAADGMFVGYRRIARGESCGFCKALADRGAVFKQGTAYFAAHDNCQCTAAAAFVGQPQGPEASVMQYTASKRRRTPAEKARINAWAASYA
ncbi:hypothetical protein EDF60_1681 [Leucobacter luti]|uniref:VG15 protein n=1 Tax=Leucobacter luti TaxID=340320 RepID=UPI0010508A6F|nr:hypothetical protein [Leucobacter luti]MCW2287030.1 hypothetical protein [Leucobacter luti]TCK41255.1 hypothetical protein EDF60_1681 [Leucobacter luti]